MPTQEEITDQENTFETEDTSEPIPPADIVAYNELRSCADLFRLYTSGKLEIQPDFQREVVWKSDDQTRFIDSLVKQLPIPSMCFSLDYKTQRWKVIDGLQRMSSIIKVLSTGEWKLGNLSDIHPRLRGATNVELKQGDDEQKRLYSMIEDVSIPITVIRCDYTKKGHMGYLFTIFHRLNSGGMRLTNQEIRNCIYTSPYNDIIKRFDRDDSNWQIVKKRIWGKMDRFRSVEVLLRVMAFGDWLERYDGNLARFLNDYMAEKASLSADELSEVSRVLADVASLARNALSAESQKKLSLTLVEAILVAAYVNRLELASAAPDRLKALYADLIKLPSFSANARYAISSVDNVKSRLGDAIKYFST